MWQNQALEQTRDSVLRYGESVGRELLNFFVPPLLCSLHERCHLGESRRRAISSLISQ